MLQPRLITRQLPRLPSTSHLNATPLSPSLTPFARRRYATTEVSQPAVAAAAAVFEFADRPMSAIDKNSPMRTYKPRTPGTRHLIRPINDHLWKGRAYLPLTYPRKGQHIGGRNNTGQVRVRHRGGGAKRRIRIVDFARWKAGERKVERIEYDPGRSAHIALVKPIDSTQKDDYSYILAAEGMRAGDVVQSFRAGVPQSVIDQLGGTRDPAMIAAKTAWRGNCMPLKMVPPGTLVFNVGLSPLRGGQLCRSAGTYATVLGVDEGAPPKWKDYINVKLQSGEVRRIHHSACATIGVASNVNHNRRQLGKAGRSRNLGIRPTVRGVAMNAADHPHGGGRGKSKGNRNPVSIWGRVLAKGGFKTRKKSNINRAVVSPRPRSKGKRK